MCAKGARSASECLCVLSILRIRGKVTILFSPCISVPPARLPLAALNVGHRSQAARVANISDVLYAAAAPMTECLAVSVAAAPAMYTVPTSTVQSRLGGLDRLSFTKARDYVREETLTQEACRDIAISRSEFRLSPASTSWLRLARMLLSDGVVGGAFCHRCLRPLAVFYCTSSERTLLEPKAKFTDGFLYCSHEKASSRLTSDQRPFMAQC